MGFFKITVVTVAFNSRGSKKIVPIFSWDIPDSINDSKSKGGFYFSHIVSVYQKALYATIIKMLFF